MIEKWLAVDDRERPVVVAGVVLGLGLGGFFDGIVFHQVLQWHHMLTAHPDPAVAGDLELNVLVDGLFHVATYLLTVAGLALLWRAWRRADRRPAARVLVGSLLVGWGLFNLLEGLVNHQLLGIHHVWPAGPGSVLLWDLLFLAWGAGMLLAGALLVRSAPASAPASGADGPR